MAFGKASRGFVAAIALLSVASIGSALAQASRNPPAGAASKGAPPSAVGPNAMQGFSKNQNKPVQIEAASLEVRDKEKKATFIGNVHVVQGDTTMRCKILVVHYDGEAASGMKAAQPGPGGQQQITRLEAKGNVVVTQADQTATGDNGLFDMRSNTITLTGNVVVSQGKNVVRGERLLVDMTTGVSTVEAGAGGGPVRMLIEQTGKDGATTTKSPQVSIVPLVCRRVGKRGSWLKRRRRATITAPAIRSRKPRARRHPDAVSPPSRPCATTKPRRQRAVADESGNHGWADLSHAQR